MKSQLWSKRKIIKEGGGGGSLPENSIHAKEKKSLRKMNHLSGGKSSSTKFILSAEHPQEQGTIQQVTLP